MSNSKRPRSTDVDRPTKQSVSNGKSASRSVEFVNCHLDTNDKDWLRSTSNDSPACVSEFLLGLTETERLSVKFDPKSLRFVAYLFEDSLHSPNTGCALTVRGATAHDALFALAYCHKYKFAFEWGNGTDDVGADIDPWG